MTTNVYIKHHNVDSFYYFKFSSDGFCFNSSVLVSVAGVLLVSHEI